MFCCPILEILLHFCILGGDGENEENEGMSDDDKNASGSDDWKKTWGTFDNCLFENISTNNEAKPDFSMQQLLSKVLHYVFILYFFFQKIQLQILHDIFQRISRNL